MQYSIIINGKPRGRIKPSRGIRQGDPISPFIFVIDMDYLSRILLHLEKTGKIRGVVLHENLNLTHLLFADDILLFVEDNDDSIENLRYGFNIFEAASGLNINRSKSSITPINVNSNRGNMVTNRWGINSTFLFLTSESPLEVNLNLFTFGKTLLKKSTKNSVVRNTLIFQGGEGWDHPYKILSLLAFPLTSSRFLKPHRHL